jgi:hypothetical protein
LFADAFDRADSDALGNGWLELEASGAVAALQGGRLCFPDTSDLANRPQVRASFQRVSTGQLVWTFDFDWKKTGAEGTYRVLMQLGDGALMLSDEANEGVGVNLVWNNAGGIHESLAYRSAGRMTGLGVVSGLAQIEVRADLAARQYTVLVNGTALGSGLPFDDPVELDTVRLMADVINERNYAGRCFDNLVISKP